LKLKSALSPVLRTHTTIITNNYNHNYFYNILIADVPPPLGVEVHKVESAREMLSAVQAALPADAAVFVAAVADWRVEGASTQKIKKQADGALPVLQFAENPDILATISQLDIETRPKLVVGFAAETNDVLENATAKRVRDED